MEGFFDRLRDRRRCVGAAIGIGRRVDPGKAAAAAAALERTDAGGLEGRPFHARSTTRELLLPSQTAPAVPAWLARSLDQPTEPTLPLPLSLFLYFNFTRRKKAPPPPPPPPRPSAPLHFASVVGAKNLDRACLAGISRERGREGGREAEGRWRPSFPYLLLSMLFLSSVCPLSRRYTHPLATHPPHPHSSSSVPCPNIDGVGGGRAAVTSYMA